MKVISSLNNIQNLLRQHEIRGSERWGGKFTTKQGPGRLWNLMIIFERFDEDEAIHVWRKEASTQQSGFTCWRLTQLPVSLDPHSVSLCISRWRAPVHCWAHFTDDFSVFITFGCMHRWLSRRGEEQVARDEIRGRSTWDYSSVYLIKGLAFHCQPYLARKNLLSFCKWENNFGELSTTCSNSLEHQSVDFGFTTPKQVK